MLYCQLKTMVIKTALNGQYPRIIISQTLIWHFLIDWCVDTDLLAFAILDHYSFMMLLFLIVLVFYSIMEISYHITFIYGVNTFVSQYTKFCQCGIIFGNYVNKITHWPWKMWATRTSLFAWGEPRSGRVTNDWFSDPGRQLTEYSWSV